MGKSPPKSSSTRKIIKSWYNKPWINKVSIELVTLADLTDAATGKRIYNVLAHLEQRLAPHFVSDGVEPINIPVGNESTWLTHWAQSATISGPGVNNIKVNRGTYWQRPDAIKNWGSALHTRQRRIGSQISIYSHWDDSVEWTKIFDELVEICTPEYARLHVFSEAELDSLWQRKPFRVGPLSTLVGWLVNSGHVRVPDSWENEKWGRYIFLPELSWRNFLSTGFDGQYNESLLEARSHHVNRRQGGIAFSVTPNLNDVVDRFPSFGSARAAIRATFVEDFFRP